VRPHALTAIAGLVEAMASVGSESGENRCSPDNRGPDAHRGAQEPCDDDGEKEGYVGAEQEAGATSKSEHEG
jgi:hypothetical protein